MQVALGLKAHSGWSVLVMIGIADGEPEVIDRRRIELVEAKDASWARQPYHSADGLATDDARDIIKRGIEAARRIAVQEMLAAVRRSREWQHEIVACAVLVPSPMPSWSIDEIRSVHIRMHKAEGVLYPDALARAAGTCGLRLVAIPESRLGEQAENVLKTPLNALTARIGALGKSVGSPWGVDQQNATLAALVALQGQLN